MKKAPTSIALTEAFIPKTGYLVCRRNQQDGFYHTSLYIQPQTIQSAEKSPDRDSPERSLSAGVDRSSAQYAAISRQACRRNVDNRKHKGHL
jgi:hypothetical protein